MLAIGSEAVCEEQIAASTRQVVDELEDQCKLVVPITKLEVVASRHEVTNKTCAAWTRLNDASRRSVRNLWSDFASGGIVQNKLRKSRINTVRQRATRLKRVSVHGVCVKRISRSGLLPAGMYGVGVTRLSDGDVIELRRTLHPLVAKKPKGRSTTADFSIAGVLTKASGTSIPCTRRAPSLLLCGLRVYGIV